VRAQRTLWLIAGVVSALATPGRAQEFAPSLYVRADTDHTTVVSPRLRGRAEVADATNLDLVYAVDIWTSASVDVVASASEPVTEQRDEIDVTADHTFTDFVLSAGYRYSHEPDYISHGGHIGGSLDLADKSTTLGLGLAFSVDDVGRAGYPDFSYPAQTFGVQTSLTQVIDRDTLVQALYDLGQVSGYQVSPYRRVALGGDGNCAGDAPWCYPEHSPDQRLRHAWAVRLRRALGDHTSAGAGYRFYLDSWGMISHTLSLSASWVPTQQTTLSLQYRGYVQSAVDYYQKHYDLSALGSYTTADKELSPLTSQRLLLDLEQIWKLDQNTILRTALSLGPTFYAYSDYAYLDSMLALDVTGTAVLVF
jgi:hypothetical protein